MKNIKKMMSDKKEKAPTSMASKARMDSLEELRRMAMEMMSEDAKAGLGEGSPEMSVMVVNKKKGMLRPDMDEEEAEEMLGPDSLEDYVDDMTTDEEYDNGMSNMEEDEDLKKKLRR